MWRGTGTSDDGTMGSDSKADPRKKPEVLHGTYLGDSEQSGKGTWTKPAPTAARWHRTGPNRTEGSGVCKRTSLVQATHSCLPAIVASLRPQDPPDARQSYNWLVHPSQVLPPTLLTHISHAHARTHTRPHTYTNSYTKLPTSTLAHRQ